MGGDIGTEDDSGKISTAPAVKRGHFRCGVGAQQVGDVTAIGWLAMLATGWLAIFRQWGSSGATGDGMAMVRLAIRKWDGWRCSGKGAAGGVMAMAGWRWMALV